MARRGVARGESVGPEVFLLGPPASTCNRYVNIIISIPAPRHEIGLKQALRAIIIAVLFYMKHKSLVRQGSQHVSQKGLSEEEKKMANERFFLWPAEMSGGVVVLVTDSSFHIHTYIHTYL